MTSPTSVSFRFLVALACLALGACHPTPDSPPEDEEEEAEAADSPSEVRLSAATIAAAGITIGSVQRTAISGATVIPAEVQLDPTRTAHVAPLVDGRVSEVHAVLGQEVNAGDVLATLVSADVAELVAATADARARLAVAEAATDRLAPLGESGVASRRSLLEAESDRDRARAELAGLSQRRTAVGARGGQSVALVAPLGGVVVDLHAVVGETVETGSIIFTVADTRNLWAIASAPEVSIREVRDGASAVLRVQAFPGVSFPGEVTLLAPTLDEVTRTLDVRVELQPDPTMRLRPGMFGWVALGDAGTSLVVPESALARLDGADVVFVPGDGEGEFRVVPVALGRRTSGLAEVTSGLAEGDSVVTSGSFTLKSELLRARLAEDE